MEPVEELVKRAHMELQLVDRNHPELRFIEVVHGNIVWPAEHWREYTNKFSYENGKPLAVVEELGKYHRALRNAIRSASLKSPSS